MELFLDVLAESLVDTAKMLPFLFLAYLFIEYVETRHGERIEALLAGGGRWGFVPGALLGCVPQCGFSAIASNFYASRVVTLGTLMAVFLATSDEAIPLLVATTSPSGKQPSATRWRSSSSFSRSASCSASSWRAWARMSLPTCWAGWAFSSPW